jgi:hypothetical protein
VSGWSTSTSSQGVAMWSFSAPESRPPAAAPYDGHEELTRRTADGKNGQEPNRRQKQHSKSGNNTRPARKATP